VELPFLNEFYMILPANSLFVFRIRKKKKRYSVLSFNVKRQGSEEDCVIKAKHILSFIFKWSRWCV